MPAERVGHADNSDQHRTDTNLAFNQPAMASSTTGANSVTWTFDENVGTRWESLYSDPQYIYVDLGQVDSIHSVVLNWETAAGASIQST